MGTLQVQVGLSAVVGRPADKDDGPNRSNEEWLQLPEMPCFGSENRIGREEKGNWEIRL